MTSAIITPKVVSSSLLGRKVRIVLLDTWGDAFYVGLTGISIMTKNGPLMVQKHWVSAVPRDMNVIPGYSGDYRTLDKLINNRNATTNDHNMWLIPFCRGKSHYIEIDLQESKQISGLVFWNYNKSAEDTTRGARSIGVYIDGKCATPNGWTLRKAPGHDQFDFGQLLPLPCPGPWAEEMPAQSVYATEISGSDYETPHLPQGFIFKFRLLGTWGDMHYIGMNGVELYDERGAFISTDNCMVTANPDSLRALPGMAHDLRTPDKLTDGINRTMDDRHMWLAPFSEMQPNEFTLTFDRLITIGFVKLWNYAKTPERGVKEFEICVDDLVVYKGDMRRAESMGDFSTAVLFTGDRAVVGRNVEQVFRNAGGKPQVLLYNERNLVAGMEEKRRAAERPFTGVVWT